MRVVPTLQPCTCDVMPETKTLLSRLTNVELDFTAMKNHMDTLNSDAEITDENIARLGCRITNIEQFLKERGLSLPLFD